MAIIASIPAWTMPRQRNKSTRAPTPQVVVKTPKWVVRSKNRSSTSQSKRKEEETKDKPASVKRGAISTAAEGCENKPPPPSSSSSSSSRGASLSAALAATQPFNQGQRGGATSSCWTTPRRLFTCSTNEQGGAATTTSTPKPSAVKQSSSSNRRPSVSHPFVPVLSARKKAAEEEKKNAQMERRPPSNSKDVVQTTTVPTSRTVTPDTSVVTNVVKEMDPNNNCATSCAPTESDDVSELPKKMLFDSSTASDTSNATVAAPVAVGERCCSEGITSPWDIKAPFMLVKEEDANRPKLSKEDKVVVSDGSFFSFSANSPLRRTRCARSDSIGSVQGYQRPPPSCHYAPTPPPPHPHASVYGGQSISSYVAPVNQIGWAPGTFDIGGLRYPLHNVPLYSPYMHDIRGDAGSYPPHYPLHVSSHGGNYGY